MIGGVPCPAGIGTGMDRQSAQLASFRSCTYQIYLAARYSRRKELCSYKADLEARCHTVPARWLTGAHQVSDAELADHETVPTEKARLFAAEDLEDILAANMLIAFTEEPRLVQSRGGRHVELGIGIGLRRARQAPVPKLFVVGPTENVFCALDDIDGVYGSWDEFLDALDAGSCD